MRSTIITKRLTNFCPRLAPGVEHTRLPLVASGDLGRVGRVEGRAGRRVPVEEGPAGVALQAPLLPHPRHPAAVIKGKNKVL